jgi:hypothetical protein
MKNSKFRKWLYISIGILSVVLATVGVFLPLLPTTPFLLLAAACFIRSSEGLYQWLITHRVFGPYIKNYWEHRAITLHTKVGILILLWATIGYGVIGIVQSLIVRAILVFIAIGVTIHVLSLKTLTPDMLDEEGVATLDLSNERHCENGGS